MRPFTVSVIGALLLTGCEDTYYEPVQPHLSTPLRGRASTIPQWPMFHHDARHTGNVNTPLFDVAGPRRDTVGLLWRTAIDFPLEGSPAVGTDGTIYFGTRNYNFWDMASFYALNPDGTTKWRYRNIGSVFSTPAIGDDGSLFVGAVGGFYAFTPTGLLKWRNPEAGNNVSSPAIGRDGTVYYVTGYVSQDYLKAVDPTSGSLRWQIRGGDQLNSPSVAADGTIYYSSEGTITAVTPNGDVKWKYKDTSYGELTVSSIQLGYDGTAYFVSNQSTYLYAIDAQGNLKWKYNIHGGAADPCLDMDGNILAVGEDRTLMAIGANGRLNWTTSLLISASATASLTIDKNHVVYIGISDEYSTQVSLEAFRNSSLLWQFGPNVHTYGGSVYASPAVFNGSLFFAWAYGPPYIYCLH